MRWHRPILPLTLLAGAVMPAAAQNTTTSSHIDAIVAAFTGKAIGEVGGAAHPVDPRLRLADCPQAPVAEWYGNQQQSVRVHCPISGGWRVFVSVNGAARAAPVVNRGDLVQVRIAGAGFSMSTRGEALGTGAVGAAISVRPAYGTRKQTVTAKVLEAGVVGIEVP